MISLKQKMLNLLHETVAYYSIDPIKLRSRSSDNCFYSPVNSGQPDSKGCAIGRLIEDEDLKKELDQLQEEWSVNIRELLTDRQFENVTKQLPEYLLQFPPIFLNELQILHDTNGHWNINGLTDRGLNAVAEIESWIEEYEETPV